MKLDDSVTIEEGDSITIGNKVIEQVGVIGEKIEVSKYEKIEAALVLGIKDYFKKLNFKKATFLRRIASVFSKPDLNVVSRKHR